MNYRMTIKLSGRLLFIEAAALILPFFAGLIYREREVFSIAISIGIFIIAGLLTSFIKTPDKHIYAKEGMAVVGIGWILVSATATLPFLISGAIPSFIDAFFEMCSGFSTTGATILPDVETLPQCLMLWRSLTHWLGGLGFLILMLAIMPQSGADTLFIMAAESPGPSTEKFVPKVKRAAKILYLIYAVMTLILVVLLLAGGMSFFDSLIHAFGTASTGGFANHNASIGYYNSAYIDIVITVSMILFGVNFSLYYLLLRGKIKDIFKDEELRFYMGIILISILLIAIDIMANGLYGFLPSLRHSSFQVGSIITTTGYATADFNLWPSFSKIVLVLLMFIGASAGSAGGGIKCIRLLVLLKMAGRQMSRLMHPRSVRTIKVNGKSVDEELMSGISIYFFLYITIAAVAIMIVSLDGRDLVTSATAVFAAISNIGPGLEAVGPIGNFSAFSNLSKFVMSICMIIGRLEIYPILTFFTPSFWRR